MPFRRQTPALLALLLVACTRERSPSPPAKLSDAPKAKITRPPAASAATLVARARRAAKMGNLEVALVLADQARAADPRNRDALWVSAQVTQALGQKIPRPEHSSMLLKSAEAMRTLRATYPKLSAAEKRQLPGILYNEACTLALGGEAVRAIQSLGEAFEAGLDGMELLDSDPDLDALRQRPDFQALVARIERIHARDLLARGASQSFAFDFRLPDLDGTPRALADLRGNVTVVNLWGTWCVPCRKDVPHLADLYQRYHERGLAVVGLSYEAEEGEPARKTLRAFVEQAGIPYPCLIGDRATRDRIPGFEGYPTTLFLDRRGTVRLKVSGYLPRAELNAIVEALFEDVRTQTDANSKSAPRPQSSPGRAPRPQVDQNQNGPRRDLK